MFTPLVFCSYAYPSRDILLCEDDYVIANHQHTAPQEYKGFTLKQKAEVVQVPTSHALNVVLVGSCSPPRLAHPIADMLRLITSKLG